GDGRGEFRPPARRRGRGRPDLYDGNARQDRPRPGGGGAGRRSVGVPALYAALGGPGRRRVAGRPGLRPPGAGRPAAGRGRAAWAGAGRAVHSRGVNFRITPEKVISSRSPVTIWPRTKSRLLPALVTWPVASISSPT